MTTRTSGAIAAVMQPQSAAVIQCARTGSDAMTGTISIRARTTAPGRLFARLLRSSGKVVPKFAWHVVGESDGAEAGGELPQAPVGGEYTLELELRARNGRVLGAASINRLLVGDLWITAGQSNMDGYGKLVGTEPPSRMVHAFYFDDRWDTARDPLCWYNEAVDSIHWGERGPEKRPLAAARDRRFRQAGSGPAVAFGKAIAARTGVPIGLVVCSHGGTSMEQWSPARCGEGGASLYGSLVRRVRAVGGKVTGIIWYQGESDANTQAQPRYRQVMREFVASMRRDLGAPDLSFLYVQIGPFYAGNEIAPMWNAIQSDQLGIEADLAPAAMTSAIDLGLDDAIHIDTVSQRRLGRRLAHLAEMLVYGRTALRRGPRPANVRFANADRTTLRVRYTDVNMGLKPTRGIRGFWVRKDGQDIAIERQEVDPNQPDTVVLRFEEPVPPGSELWYGLGINPAVNLVDDADMAAPVFGPVTI